jgi:hypothetical protein
MLCPATKLVISELSSHTHTQTKPNTNTSQAVSYYEASEVSVIFSIPSEAGRLLYIGYDYSQMVPAWTDILLLAMRMSPN